jgi:integrase/recombinase XerD
MAHKEAARFDISIYLDTRRKTKDGTYPVKLKVYDVSTKERKYYPIGDKTKKSIYMAEKDFQSIVETVKPRKEHKEQRAALNTLKEKAKEVASSLDQFNFDDFTKLWDTDKVKNKQSVESYYNDAIDQFNKQERTGTAVNYKDSIKSLLGYHNSRSSKSKTLLFSDISADWLEGYEKYMLNKGRSQTTVGIYLRPLRAIFNTAISEKSTTIETYPFGKRKYTIPAPKATKKALNHEQLGKLFNGIPQTTEQEQAKDFWFFSYACNGMNIKDIANLKFKDISGEMLTFKRAKTSNTNKSQAAVKVAMNDFTANVIEKYGNPNHNPDNLIFKILDPAKDHESNHRKLKNFIRFVNQHFKNYAESLGIEGEISTYWARHSYATNAIRKGASMEFVGNALGHSNLKTTMGYFGGFEDDKIKEISKQLMDFN